MFCLYICIWCSLLYLWQFNMILKCIEMLLIFLSCFNSLNHLRKNIIKGDKEK